MSETNENEGRKADDPSHNEKPSALPEKVQKRYEDDIIKWKSEYKATKEELEDTKIKTEREKNELAAKLDTIAKEKTSFEQKYINAEVKAQAIAAGIKDIELVQLVDKASISIDENGNIVGADKAIENLKTRKPDWFGAEKKISTTKNAGFPDKESKKTVDARSMSKEEWAAKKSQYFAGRF